MPSTTPQELAARLPSGLLSFPVTPFDADLQFDEALRSVRTAVDEIGGRVPVIASATGGTAQAIAQARAAQEAGADGLLLMPPYAVSIIKVGLRAIGRPAGPVRPPLVDLTDTELAELSVLIGKVS